MKLPAGGTAAGTFPRPARAAGPRSAVHASEPPEGIASRKRRTPDGLDLVFRAEAAKIKPGWKGNLIVEAFVMRIVEPRIRRPTSRSSGGYRWACARRAAGDYAHRRGADERLRKAKSGISARTGL